MNEELLAVLPPEQRITMRCLYAQMRLELAHLHNLNALRALGKDPHAVLGH